MSVDWAFFNIKSLFNSQSQRIGRVTPLTHPVYVT
uniref:Uncharacterized protein n=1 Tax=Anguilla anguilla TaxID=7936 RepID=A0A0E9TJ45_ANGAN